MTISNNKISHLVSGSLPFFVRNDHATFVRFIEAYYEFLEQENETVNVAKNLRSYQNVDLTIDDFAEYLYSTFLKLLPKDTIADKAMILKHAKDFYRAKGTEKSVRFLMRILFDEEIDLYYPKKDVLRASDGKWYIQKSLRITDTAIEGVPDNSLAALENYIGTRILGETSNTSALVERVDRFYEQGTQIDELIISNIDGDFENGEMISAEFNDVEDIKTVTSNILSGIISSVTIINPGSLYQVGDPVIVVSNTGTGACVSVAAVSSGNIASIIITDPAAGYRINDLLISIGGGGSGFNGAVLSVSANNYYHPNTYNITNSIIALEADTLLSNAIYSNLSSTNANSNIVSALSFWQYAPTGPLESIIVLSAGDGYTSLPDISIVGNNAIRSLGILGRMNIVSGGTGYQIGDNISFTNVLGGYGTGAWANVTNVDGSGAITKVNFKEIPGHIIGGSGYDTEHLPLANVESTTGSGANIAVTHIINYGAEFQPVNTTFGQIERIIITARGTNYTNTGTTLDLTGYGDGTATANVTVLQGLFTYPGRYLNDDGHLSSYNFLQDRDYYQNYSYVIRVKKSIDQYRQAMKELIHPIGMKMFGEYTFIEENTDAIVPDHSDVPIRSTYAIKSYEKEANTVNISYTSHGLAANANVYLEYITGGYANVVNGIYMVTISSSNYFHVEQSSNTGNASGTVDVGIIIT